MRRRWRRWALIWGAALLSMWAVFGMVGSPGEHRGGESAAAVAADAVDAAIAADVAIAAVSAMETDAAGAVSDETDTAGTFAWAKDSELAKDLTAVPLAAAARTTAVKMTPAAVTRAPAASGSAARLQPSVPATDALRPTVYLTFDDGPSEHTARVLDLLEDEGIAATFFVLGEQAERYPELMRRIVEEGHAVGNHSYNHRYEELYGNFRSFAGQMRRTEEAIVRTAGVRTRLVRAPGGTFGNFDQSYFRALEEAGYLLFDWNVDSGDAKRRNVPATEIVRNVTKAPLRDVMVVLMHDGNGHAETVKALPAIIAHFKRHGYAFGVLSEQVEPVVFRVAPRLKWERNAVSLDAALAWLGGEEAAAVRAASTAQVRVADAENRSVPAVGTAEYRGDPAIEEAIPSGRLAAGPVNGDVRLSGWSVTGPVNVAGRLSGWPLAGPMNVAERFFGWPLTDPVTVPEGTRDGIRFAAGYRDTSMVMANYRDGSMATAGYRDGADVSHGEAEHEKTAALALAPQELFRTATRDYVPVRLWGERSGGVVRWEQRPAKATVAWSGAVLEITPDDGLLEIATATGRRFWKADVRLIDGTLYVDADTFWRAVSSGQGSGPDRGWAGF